VCWLCDAHWSEEASLAGGDSFEEFYATAYRRIVGQVFALLGDLHEAEDLTQDAFAMPRSLVADRCLRRARGLGAPGRLQLGAV
jgi:hypothetical protein